MTIHMLHSNHSVPQMKTSIIDVASTLIESNAEKDPCLDMEDGNYKSAILFGGTVLVNHSNADSTEYKDNTAYSIPNSPDGGFIAFVLRTGFDTQQGSLLRTMVHTSTKQAQSNTANSWDTFIFILILLSCAMMSSGYVLFHGWNDPTRNRFKLVLHVIIIITSVVPPELPMELSLAVTSSISDLVHRCSVYCTEPFRIPLAGMVNTCCFDKTGTLTSDEMILRGVRVPILVDGMLQMSSDLRLPVADVDEGEVNLGIPKDSLRVMVGCQSLTTALNPKMNSARNSDNLVGDPLEKAVLDSCGWNLLPNNIVAPPESLLRTSEIKPVQVLHRYAFTSKLKRMTVIAKDLNDPDLWALSKGAPETLKDFMDPNSLPENYDSVSRFHMSKGQRVLAQAYKKLKDGDVTSWKKKGRSEIERNLIFAGLIVLDCPLKPDTRKVIKELRNSNHSTVMITGDAVLTSAEVAKQCGIISTKGNGEVYELRNLSEMEGENKLAFVPIHTPTSTVADSEKCIAYSDANMGVVKDLLQTGDIRAVCVTGDTLDTIAMMAVRKNMKDSSVSYVDQKTVLLHPDSQRVLQKLVPFISVFARHAPRQKEAVIAAMNGAGRITLMCGDGTNDVGALKMAHCGISIISVPDLEAKQRNALDGLQQLQESGPKSTKKKKTKSRKSTWDEHAKALMEAEEELNKVGLGDASVASPFTSRVTSIKCTTDVLQRGRCTLVTMNQIYKILGVNCLVNALVLSTLHLSGVKQGDTQLTAVGIVVAGLFFFVTKGQPLNKLSRHRPPSSVLSKQVLLSIALQFSIHSVSIMAIATLSKLYLDSFDPSLVPDGAFNPNILNSATFIMTVICTVNTFVVNYRGRPYMEDLRENKMMVRALQFCYTILFCCALEIFPPLNDLLQLAPLPSDSILVSSHSYTGDIYVKSLQILAETIGFKSTLCFFMVVDSICSYLGEKSLIRFFERSTTK
jgi:manganese-transporting P-type ATPase